MKLLEETRLTRDRPYSCWPRVTTPNQDREIRPTHIETRFGSVVQTIHGRQNPRSSAKTVLRRLCANYIRLQRAFASDNRRQRLQLKLA